MIKTSIVFDQDVKEIYDCINPDLTREFKRSKIDVDLSDKELRFDIEANDIVALKATLNSITQMVDVFYKMKNNVE